MTAGSTLVGSSRSVSSRRLSRSAALLSRVARRRRSAAEIPRSCPMRATSNGSQAASSLTSALFCQKAFTASTSGLISSTSTFDRDWVCCIMASYTERSVEKTLTKCRASCIDLNQIAPTAMNPFSPLWLPPHSPGVERWKPRERGVSRSSTMIERLLRQRRWPSLRTIP
jgi:hypothetical protein